MKAYQRIARCVAAAGNCRKSGNDEWLDKHTVRADDIVREHFPSGGGFDGGTSLDWETSSGDKLVFITGFHHMSEHGYYTRWTDHTVTVRPSFVHEVDVKVSGRNHNNIKDYIGEVFSDALSREVD